MIAVAVALRWADIGQLSLAHFDEGVLVSGAFGVWLNGLWHFPLSQPLQAPPLLPWMVAAAFGITQTPWPIMGIYLSATVGVATVVIYFYWLRRLYDDWLALAGAGLLAASDLHVAFSRMALTDVTLTFFFVLGGYLLSQMATTAPQPRASGRATQLGPLAAWAIGVGLATGAAWNTKYNGWMLLAMAATTWLIVALRGSLLDRGDTDGKPSFARPAMIVALFVAALVAVGCFAPWYRYVEQTYPGGYAAVTRNHLRYVGRLDDWPPRAARLWTSLSAFRHYGWLITLLASAVAGGYFARRVPPAHRRTGPQARSGMAVLVVICGLGAIAVSGGDATLFILAAFAIAPALIWGRWCEIFFAVWAGAFLVLTPFYHPYTRLLVPALPAVIALTVWLIATAVAPLVRGPSTSETQGRVLAPRSRSVAAGYLAAGCLAAFILAIGSHPFGLLPSRRVWDRWSTRYSYRALGDAVLDAKLPSDAMVLCQGLPAMDLYVERQWTPLEAVPFDRWLPRVAPDRECFLAVDFWGAYGENHQLALASLREHLHCFEPIAVVPNDINLATLLDYLPPAAVARHLANPWPDPQVADRRGRRVVFPARLDEPFAEVIVLYRIDRECVGRLLDKMRPSALK